MRHTQGTNPKTGKPYTPHYHSSFTEKEIDQFLEQFQKFNYNIHFWPFDKVPATQDGVGISTWVTLSKVRSFKCITSERYRNLQSLLLMMGRISLLKPSFILQMKPKSMDWIIELLVLLNTFSNYVRELDLIMLPSFSV